MKIRKNRLSKRVALRTPPSLATLDPAIPVAGEFRTARIDFAEEVEVNRQFEVLHSIHDPTPTVICTQDDVRRFLVVDLPPEAVQAAQDGTVSRQSIENMIVETAHAFYAAGSGDVLGPCVEATRPTGGTGIQLRYTWTGHTTIANSEPFYFGHIETTAATEDWRDPLTYNWASNWVMATNGTYVNYGEMCGDAVGANVFINQQHGPLRVLEPAKLEIINKKAAELLLAHLTETQRQTWLAEQYFDTLVPSGRRYRIKRGTVHNVFLLDLNNKPVREYCAYAKDPDGSLPVEDNLFAQLMTLKFNEQEFLAKANTWDITRGHLFVGTGVDAHKPVEPMVIAA